MAEAYAEKLTSSEDELIREVNEYTIRHSTDARMLSGHLQGKLLEMISFMVRPSRVLEIGTFTGYSALCLAKGLENEGKLHTIEIDPSSANLARSFFNRSNYSDRIISHTGKALDIIPLLNETWDLVFIDADKPAYIEYFSLVLPRLRKNGFILADNVFFHGEVFEQPSIDDRSPVSAKLSKSALGIRAFNEYILGRMDIEKLVLTIRDGLYLIRKL